MVLLNLSPFATVGWFWSGYGRLAPNGMVAMLPATISQNYLRACRY
jgi:hypothetical protein